MPLLKKYKCEIDNCHENSISIYGSNPYCRSHTTSLCTLKHELNVFNETRCNSTVEMISVNDNLYCNAHYRTLISVCNHP